MTFSPQAKAWLARATGIRPAHQHLTRLKGSTTSSIFLVFDEGASNPTRFVLRVVENAAWLAEEPDLAVHEAAALTEARQAGLHAPELVAYAGEEAGFGVPVVLMTCLAGAVQLRPADFSGWLAALARELATIHRHRAPNFAWHYYSWVNEANLRPPPWTTRPPAWELALERRQAAPPAVQPVFIHRDYHPTNVLWQGAALSGVVDWINACQGPAGVDVSHCRINLVLMYGPEIADQFLAAYVNAAADFAYDPFWDIDSVLDMSLPEPMFYPPWQDFGLAPVPIHSLHERVDAYLASLVERL